MAELEHRPMNTERSIAYLIGQIVEAAEGKVGDQQCDVGLHVLRLGVRPEHLGLCEPGELWPLLVEVASDDILFIGWGGCADKACVWKLKVLRWLETPGSESLGPAVAAE